MTRILGVVLNDNKKVRIALTKIYGIGLTLSKKICEKLKIDDSQKIINLNTEIIKMIQKEIEKFDVEGNLRSKIRTNIKRLKDIKCYKGLRHKKFLPVNGQRTKTNAKTRKRIKK